MREKTMMDLPLVREILPTKIAKVLRDPGWKYEISGRGCGIRYGTKK